MNSEPGWHVSATYLLGMVKVLRALGHYDRVRAGASADARTMLDDPNGRRWWPGPVLAEVLELLGPEAAREVGLRTSRDRMGPLVRPLAGVLLALSRNPTHALLSRLHTFLEPGVQGVVVRYEVRPDGTGGLVTFTFPQPVSRVVASLWAGVFDVGFALAKQGRITSETLGPAVHRYEIAW